MKKYILLITFLCSSAQLFSQNLILNPGFEEVSGSGCGFHGFSLGFSDAIIQPMACGIKNWIPISYSPDPWWTRGYDFPANYCSKYIYPHTDSVAVGGSYYYKAVNNLREIIGGKLTQPLIKNHHYQFSIYVQLFDTSKWNDVGKIVGINSFDALFTDTSLGYLGVFPMGKYIPQIQINQMVTDTQHWVQLVDTFIANGGEQFVSIGNFKTDSQTQFILVDSQSNLPEVAYYFIDDVSLIDITPLGIDEVGISKIEVYPNPTDKEINVEYKDIEANSKFIIYNYLGKEIITKLIINKYGILNIDANQFANGLYLYQIVSEGGNIISKGKFNIIHIK
ncbi:MAG: hypothetical protein RJA07_2798 [Bacteroidota bacterium]|jgi:hypothetical protein